MRRHWQHTSFCMGQCVSSCGSKRTLDSVPTTPEYENYPGLIPSTKIIHCKKSTNFTETEDQQELALQQKSKTSSAAKFVTVFHQRRIVTRRINPEVDSPSHIRTCPIGTIINPSADATSFHHGDMKDSTVKSYFRETISSAKKSSSKSVTFSEVSPLKTGSRKKSFFSFSKSRNRKAEETHSQVDSSASPALSKVFLIKRSKNSEHGTLIVQPHKEKQVCRVTLSPKHGTTVANVAVHHSSPVQGSGSLKLDPNGDEGTKTQSPVRATASGNHAMGNASSSSQGLVVEAVKTIKPIVKSNSFKNKNPNVDLNENDTKGTCAVLKKSVESPGLTRKDSKRRYPVPLCKNDSKNVTKDINKIKEENRLLRLKFFLEDTQKNPFSPIGNNKDLASKTTQNMSRQNIFLANRSAIPLPKSTVGKPGNNASAIPKLYSVPSNENEQIQKTTKACPSSRLKSNVKGEPAVQPTNLNSGNWVPAADFFDPAASSQANQSDSSPSRSTSKTPRRCSEPPPRSTPPGNIAPQKPIRDPKGPEIITERRGTIGLYQQRKLQLCQNSGNVPKPIKPVPITDKTGVLGRNVPIRVVGIKKPEETKPFYTIGLYQNRPKPTETTKAYSGFHGVSTGIVRQRTQQFQSKVAESPNAKVQSNLKDSVREKSPVQASTSPAKPGVLRSATYTIRKHGLVEDRVVDKEGQPNKSVIKSKSDVDPRYLTWTIRKPGTFGAAKANPSASTHFGEDRNQEDVTRKEFAATSAMLHPLGYPLQHNLSGASTSSMGTNEDGIGDHVVISDSEYLIDDEISDQPDLTLTFKDSSHKLSSSSSGESLLSDIMLDHLDLNQERLLGELTSDSAISDISSHKPVSKSMIICDQTKVQETSKSLLLEKSCVKTPEKTNSPHQTPSPSSVKSVRNVKSPRRAARPAATTPKSSAYPVLHAEPFNTSRSASSLTKSSSTSNASSKYRVTPDKKPALSKSTYGKSNLQLNSSNISPSIRSRASSKVEQTEHSKLTVENVNKLHKQLENTNCSHTCDVHHAENLPMPFAEELLVEFHDLRDKLEKLQIQLETQERREREKDELILRLTSEVECFKSGENGECLPEDKEKSRNFLSSRWDDEETDTRSAEKERLISRSLNYENAAVQTENNNIFNRAVSYPEEDEKYGELVSFRIGRSSSLKKKL